MGADTALVGILIQGFPAHQRLWPHTLDGSYSSRCNNLRYGFIPYTSPITPDGPILNTVDTPSRLFQNNGPPK